VLSIGILNILRAMVWVNVLVLCMLSATQAAQERTFLPESHASTIAEVASSTHSEQEMHLVADTADAETTASTPRNYLMAVLCTALAYFMNFEALFKSLNPNNHPAEDAKLGIGDDAKLKFDERVRAQGGVDRWTRIAVNQLENFPFHMWVLWGALMAGGGADSVAQCFVAYMTFRALFVICYVYSLAPWRTIVFLCSQVTIVCAAYLGISGASSTTDSTYRSFRLAAMSITVLFFFMNFLARARSINPNNHPAEDAAIGLSEDSKQEFNQAREGAGVNRWERIAVNQAESIPIAFAVYWGAYGVGMNPATLMYLFVSYAALRVVFVMCYVFSLQPFRSLSWGFSNLLTLVVGMMGVSAAAGGGTSSHLLMAFNTLFVFLLNFFGLFKASDPTNHPAEDSAIGVDDSKREEHAKRIEEQGVDRWTRISANQLENFPIHLFVFWGAASISGNLAAISYCFTAYATFRFLFVICYLNGIQPFRTFSFVFSQFSVVVAIVIAVSTAKAARSDGPWLPLIA